MQLLTKVNDELHDLQASDPFFPPDANATSTLEVVPVHDHVHQQVDGNRNPLHSSQTNKLGIAEKSRGAVVVGVKEGQGLLLEEEEHRVDQFEVFGQVVKLAVPLVFLCRFAPLYLILDQSNHLHSR